ncbi:hypothetical protein L1887_15186 [Cichorium endivia]|nr:hypothetical protein L1887_15186 [Cichorium endivia]
MHLSSTTTDAPVWQEDLYVEEYDSSPIYHYNIFYVYETLLLTASLLSQMGMTVVVITLGAVGLVVTKVAMIARASRITNIDQIDVVKVHVQEAETISSKDEHFELGFFKVVKANPCL